MSCEFAIYGCKERRMEDSKSGIVAVAAMVDDVMSKSQDFLEGRGTRTQNIFMT